MSTPVLLRTRNLSRSFGGLHAVSALDLEVHAGEIVCLIGPNGAGKSTTFNMIAGALAPSDGEILFDDVPMNHLATHEVARRGIARTFQHNHPFAGMSIIENVMVGMHARLQRPLWKTLTQVRQHVGEEQGARDRALELLEFVGLAHCRDLDVNTLSFGQGGFWKSRAVSHPGPGWCCSTNPPPGSRIPNARISRTSCAALPGKVSPCC
ncbi:ABC transporter ATP-binding protein [Diaphorobacter aerolatus]|uniref:ATP-binding cassette domain-containing protein n=1 Tax=Diaphorobacter aerolatus TaxID=1288495 RepID=A0A7H0GL17_9BURK|nr:ATP-binding cassette domain-containing protein [Diaphorobacter aerolatus]QNP48983.1 ATP-binding cassette domain-containing protein [Diaphorobacter aerolatus]